MPTSPDPVPASQPPAADAGAATAPLLAYATPRVFYAGVHRARSREGLAAVAVCFLMAVGFSVGSVGVARSLNAPPPVRAAFAGAFGLFAAALWAGVLYGLWGWVTRNEVPVRVTEYGIERGRRAWNWGQISGFGGTRSGAGVVLEFTTSRNAIKLPRHLVTTPALDPEEFRALVRELAAYLAEHHPQVEVDPAPRDD